MDKQISKGLKYLFLFHFITGVVLGLIYMIMPGQYSAIIDWPLKEEAPYRLIGAALSGYGFSSWLAYKNGMWEQVRILVLTEVVWCGLGGIVMLWSMLYAGLPAIGWLNTGLLFFFAAAFAYLYKREK